MDAIPHHGFANPCESAEYGRLRRNAREPDESRHQGHHRRQSHVCHRWHSRRLVESFQLQCACLLSSDVAHRRLTTTLHTQSIASSLVTQWQTLATSSDRKHLTLAVRRGISPFVHQLTRRYSTGMIQGSFFGCSAYCLLLTPEPLL